MKSHLNFLYKETSFKIIKNLFLTWLFKKLTLKSTNLFLRGTDSISIFPQIFGLHEECLTDFINTLSCNGHNDFLIDIGANIGLISCQNGNSFSEVHMFEPNLLCCNILEVNANIALTSTNFKIYKYGLGLIDQKVNLTIPRFNWGGAFIKNSENSYSDQTLATKDGFKSLDNSNYFELEISIKNTTNECAELFSLLLQKKLVNGVIKIDVEGFESTVLLGIAKSIPLNMSVFICFESWDSNFDLDEILDAFQGRCTAFKISRFTPWQKEWSKIRKLTTLIFFPTTVHTKLTNVDKKNCMGDIVLEIRSINSELAQAR